VADINGEKLSCACISGDDINGGNFVNYEKAEPFLAIIDSDGTIYQYNGGRKGVPVGIDTQKENELLSQLSEMQGVTENYYEKLVEVGVIVPQKTPEQVAKEAAEEQKRILQAHLDEQRNVNNTLLELVKVMQNEISGLKNGGATNVGNAKKRGNKDGLPDVGEVGSGNIKSGNDGKGTHIEEQNAGQL
jgi:hypothetical protein